MTASIFQEGTLILVEEFLTGLLLDLLHAHAVLCPQAPILDSLDTTDLRETKGQAKTVYPFLRARALQHTEYENVPWNCWVGANMHVLGTKQAAIETHL